MPAQPFPFQLDPFSPTRFQILDLLGEGGMGQVYRARDRHLNRQVALKLMSGPESPERLARLVMEAQCLALLDHPHLIKVYELGRWEGRACAVIQLVEGATLARKAAELQLPDRIRLVAQAARGVHAAHRQGLLHRDLKPQNILVGQGEDGQVRAYVTDFGLAKAVAGEGLTESGMVVGSPYYMSPEQAEGRSLLDPRSDVYSLGATLYAMATGVPPHALGPEEATLLDRLVAGGSTSVGQDHGSPVPEALGVLRRVLDEDPLLPRRRNPRVPQDLEIIILKAMEREAHRRYPSAEALAEDLERFLAGRPIEAQRASLIRRARTWGHRHPTQGVALGLVVGLGILGWGGAVVASRRARLRAEVASRFEGALQELEYKRHLQALAPLHDRSGERAEVHQRLKALREEALGLGRLGQGPRDFVEGWGWRLEGRPREALRSLKQAWDQGFQFPGVARALGLTYLEVFQAETDQLSLQGSQRKAALATLARTYLEPSLAFMKKGRVEPYEQGLHQARIAFLEGRDEEALALADAALRVTPWLYDAHVLAYRVWARRSEQAQDLPTFKACGAQAEGRVLAALALARGASELHLLHAEWNVSRSQQLNRRFGQLVPEGLSQALARCDEVLAVEPNLAWAHALRSSAWLKLGLDRLYGVKGPHAARDCFARALADADRAMALDPGDPRCGVAQAWALTMTADGATPAEALPLLERALATTQGALDKDSRLPAAYRLMAVVHQQLYFQKTALGQAAEVHVRASADACLAAHRQWPEVGEFIAMAMDYLAPLVLQRFEEGKPAEADAEMAQMIARLEEALARQGDNHRLLMTLVEAHRVRSCLQGLSGASPRAALARGLALLDQCQPSQRFHQSYLDVRFTLDYMKALELLEDGGDPRPQLRRMKEVLDQAVVERVSEDWLWLNRLCWRCLEAQIPRSPGETRPVVRARELGGSEGSKYHIPLQAAQGALLVLQAPGTGPGRTAALKKGRELMAQGFQGDRTLAWLFRNEWKRVETLGPGS